MNYCKHIYLYRNGLLSQLYNSKDKEDNGYISRTDHIALLENKFPELSTSTLTAWVEIFDIENQDKVTRQEFISCCNYIVVK